MTPTLSEINGSRRRRKPSYSHGERSGEAVDAYGDIVDALTTYRRTAQEIGGDDG